MMTTAYWYSPGLKKTFAWDGFSDPYSCPVVYDYSKTSFKMAFPFNAMGAVPQKDGSHRYLNPKPSVSVGHGFRVVTEGFKGDLKHWMDQ